MFSKSKSDQAVPQPQPVSDSEPSFHTAATETAASVALDAPIAEATPSVLSPDLTITGNVKTSGAIEVEGIVEGDIRAAHLTVRQTATINGEVIADEVVVSGRVVGRVLGMKVRLSSSAHVKGDIIHKTLAIESGANFEGSVRRHDDPVGQGQDGPETQHRHQPPRLAGPGRSPLGTTGEAAEVPQAAE